MKRCTQIRLLMAVLCFAFAAQAQEAGKDKPKLVVLPFKNQANLQALAAEAGYLGWWWHGGAQAMQDVFVTELKDAKKFRVVERERFDAFLKEKNLALSGDLDPAIAKALGKGLGVQRLLTGALTEYKLTDKRAGNKRVVAVAIAVKLIDTSTGEVVWSDEARSEEAAISAEAFAAKDARAFQDTVRPCVKRAIAKWRASKFFDIFLE
jgi:curli biogenesis system outer membrane secretion channel CsgG